METIKIYVGTQPQQMLTVKVLDHSIKKHTRHPVEVFPLFKADIAIPMPKDPKNKPRTPFSFQRFFIPQLNGYTGRAIYLDSDMHVFQDIANLWNYPMNGADVLSAYESGGTGENKVRKPQFAVMLMDCGQLKWDIAEIVRRMDNGDFVYEDLMYKMCVARDPRPVIEREWNSLEYYEAGRTCNLHYTDMNTQPWLTTENKYTSVWVTELIDAVQKGSISPAYLRDEVLAGNVRPSLLFQVKKQQPDPARLSSTARFLDRFFIAPHCRNKSTSSFQMARMKLAAKLAAALN